MKLKTIIASIAIALIPSIGFAQSTKTNAQLSEEYKHEINVINAEIKTLKAKKKQDPTNVTIDAEMVNKKAALQTAKSRKKIVDTAIKAEKAKQKAAKKAQKAHEKAERAHAAAEKMKQGLVK